MRWSILHDGQVLSGEMTMQQRSRSMRLFAIIKSTFAYHARTATLINAFLEGISLASSSVDMNPSVQTSNGFELIRQLTLEYSIRTRNEALTFRTALANKTFALSASETSPSSVVTDTFFFFPSVMQPKVPDYISAANTLGSFSLWGSNLFLFS